MDRISLWRWVGVCVVLLGLGCLSTGCSEGESNEPVTDEPAEAVVHSYPLRGRIAMLPNDSDPISELRIHHEAIEGFKMGDGEPAPMGQMTMAFSPGPDETLEGFAVGDVVEFVFEMHWEPVREMRAVGFKKLPADTVLSFESEDGAGGDGGHSH